MHRHALLPPVDHRPLPAAQFPPREFVGAQPLSRLTASSRAESPSPWIAPPVHTGDDDNDFIVHAVENLIREPMDQHPPRISMNHRIPGRMRNYIVKRGLNGRQKLITQPGTLALVLQERLLDIRGSRRADNGSHRRVRPRIRTSTSKPDPAPQGRQKVVRRKSPPPTLQQP